MQRDKILLLLKPQEFEYPKYLKSSVQEMTMVISTLAIGAVLITQNSSASLRWLELNF